MTDQGGSEGAGAGAAQGFGNDVLAERRARRAAAMSDNALLRRAEVAEATVRTLETHLSNLEDRLREAAERQERLTGELRQREDALLEGRQREYEEQQLRVEAEQRSEALHGEHHAEVSELKREHRTALQQLRELDEQLDALRGESIDARSLADSERNAARELRQRLAEKEAQLTRGETAAQERDALRERLTAAEALLAEQRQGERERTLLGERLAALDARAGELERALETQRRARADSDAILARATERYGALAHTVADLAGALAEVRLAFERQQGREEAQRLQERERMQAEHGQQLERLEQQHRAEIERLQTRLLELEQQLAEAREAARAGEIPSEPESPGEIAPPAQEESPAEEDAEAAPPAGEGTPAEDDTEAAAPAEEGADRAAANEEARRLEMSAALAAAADRLRAHISETDEPEPGDGEPGGAAPGESVSAPGESAAGALGPRLRSQPAEPEPWLARAIRRMAERRDAKLAGELVTELLGAQRLLLSEPLRYAIDIAESGRFLVSIDGDSSTVEKVSAPAQIKGAGVEFTLKGPVAAFGELAAGGTRRRLRGVKVQGKRRRLKRLLAARRPPLTLAELAGAGIRVWPGLMLLALAESIDPAWTIGQCFTLAFVVEDEQTATIYVSVRDGEPVLVTRKLEGEVAATVHSSELSLLSFFAGVALPEGSEILLAGARPELDRFLGWTDRAQGLSAAAGA